MKRAIATAGVFALLAGATFIVGIGPRGHVRAVPAVASPDFQITIAPASQTLPPGGSVSFAVGIGAIDGFADPVSLSVDGLPEGVTGEFSINPVSAPDTSFLTLTAASSASGGTFSLSVTATGGGITHTATGHATVDFGLIPICYGAVEGVVTDADTGLAIEGVEIHYRPGDPDAITDAAGHYRVERLDLGQNNSATLFGLRAVKEPDYWDARPTGPAVCDQTTPLDFTLTRVRPARVSGEVVEGNPDPSDFSVVIPTTNPIEGINVSVYLISPSVITDPDGLYDISFRLGHNNAPIDPYLFAMSEPDPTSVTPWRDGYWSRFILMGHVEAEQHVVKEIALVKKCTGSIAGRVTYGDTGLPASGIDMSGSQFYDGDHAVTDSDGRFSFPALLLSNNNAPVVYGVGTSLGTPVAGYNSASALVPIDHCGDHSDVDLVLPVAPTPKYGDVEGHVYDEETGNPVSGAQVYYAPAGAGDTTDVDGHYRLPPIFVGYNDDDVIGEIIAALHDDYWGSSVYPVNVRPNQTTTVDHLILRQHFARITGVVRDAITHAPITNAGVSVEQFQTGGQTDAAGEYAVGHVSLGYRNVPRDAGAVASADGYWPNSKTVPVLADETSLQDFDLLPICADATITGKVVNAFTEQPITNAQVSGGGVGVLTNASGDYRLEHVKVGTDNTPVQVTLSASADGFYGQTKLITVFCGAEIVVDFGRPNVTAAIEGFVTNAVSGAAIANVFVGSEFGGAATTDASGYYKLSDAPVSPDGSPRTWNVTAAPDGFDPQTKPVTVHADETARLDFSFGQVPPTQTATNAATATNTFTPTATNTFTPTATNTFTATATNTFTPTATNTFTPTATNTFTPTRTNTFTPTSTNTLSPTRSPTRTASPIAPAATGQPPLVKLPGLANLWLCQPAGSCTTAAAGIGERDFNLGLESAVTSLSPKGEAQTVGSFEFEVRFDRKLVSVSVRPGGLFLVGGSLRSDISCATISGQGFVQFRCNVKGKSGIPITGPGVLAVVHVTPTADVYSMVIASQENGIATQLINQGCDLGDLQGHAIGTTSCSDADVTLRYLEGDVNADCVVDVRDAQEIAFRWGSRTGQLLYNRRLDLEPASPKLGDGDIDAKDIQVIFGRHGSTCGAPHPPQPPVNLKS